MFDPTVGRWLQEDPKGFDAGDPNFYRYVNNSPTNATDPSGSLGIGTAISAISLLSAQEPPKDPKQDPKKQEPKLPTSNNLGWNDFKKKDKGEVGAFTGIDIKYNKNDIQTTSKADGCKFVGTATLQVKFRAEFNRERSFVLNGQAKQSLLLHERLHLAITEYFADKATRNFKPNPFGIKATGCTEDDAKENARADLIKILDTKIIELEKTSQAISDMYDKEVIDKEQKSGLNEKAQEDWATNYKDKVNEYVKTKLKWDK